MSTSIFSPRKFGETDTPAPQRISFTSKPLNLLKSTSYLTDLPPLVLGTGRSVGRCGSSTRSCGHRPSSSSLALCGVLFDLPGISPRWHASSSSSLLTTPPNRHTLCKKSDQPSSIFRGFFARNFECQCRLKDMMDYRQFDIRGPKDRLIRIFWKILNTYAN